MDRLATTGAFRATLLGALAVALWSLLAALTLATAPMPPFQLSALCFALGAALGLTAAWRAGGLAQLRLIPKGAVLFGTLGLFGYHALYFTAFRLAPGAETGLIAYLWPLLIVLFSGLLPGARLGPLHLLGAALAFVGAALLLWPAEGAGFHLQPGHALALACAFTWALYSLGARRFAAVPSQAVTLYCLASALLAGLCHLVWEQPVWPQDAWGWGALIALGLGPLGLAFFLWDIGMKKGDVPLLGVISYAAPLFSTFFLVAAGYAALRPSLVLAALCITAGAALAAWASAPKNPKRRDGSGA